MQFSLAQIGQSGDTEALPDARPGEVSIFSAGTAAKTARPARPRKDRRLLESSLAGSVTTPSDVGTTPWDVVPQLSSSLLHMLLPLVKKMIFKAYSSVIRLVTGERYGSEERSSLVVRVRSLAALSRHS